MRERTRRPASETDSEATTPAPDNETLAFMQVLWQLTHALGSQSKRMERELGVTGPQRLTLRVVGRSPGISPTEIAAFLRFDGSTVSGILQRLESRNLVRRRPHSEDGRRTCIELTAAGRKIDGTKRGTIEAKLRAVLSRAAPDDLEATRRMLRVINEALAADDSE